MNESVSHISLAIVSLGGILILIMLLKAGLKRIGVPAMVGFLAAGILIRWAGDGLEDSTEYILSIFAFFGKIGLITILFKVGLESNLKGLLEQLRRASLVWICDLSLSSAAGFVTAYYLLDIQLIPSLFITAAFTATSVGVSVHVWEDMNQLNTREGKLLVDVAEMDDISAIFIMALLFSVVPVLHGGDSVSLLRLIPERLALVCLKFFAFVAICFVFSHYAEKRLMMFFSKFEDPPDTMIIVVAFGFLIAAMAALLGLSLAIGAFFAGLLFSRDPECIKMESSFIPIYELFSPFFFIGVGMDMNPAGMAAGLALGIVLLAAAVAGKVTANGIPVGIMYGTGTAALIGVSMIPRAEITMVIMQTGLNLGPWAVPQDIFSAMIVVSAGTCLISPIGVKAMLKKYQTKEA